MIILINNPEISGLTCRLISLESLLDVVGPPHCVTLIPPKIDTSQLHWKLARIANVHGAPLLRTTHLANCNNPRLTRETIREFARCA